MNILYKIILVLSIVGFVLPMLSFAQQESPIEAPENFEEAGSFIGKFIEKIPQEFNNAWEQAKEIWRNTWGKWWNESIKSWLQNIWQKICSFFSKEIEERKPIIEEEFEKEKEEMKEDISKEAAKRKESLWEWLKGLVKDSL